MPGRLQIKALGDHTRQLARRLAAGQAVTVEGPYGRFVVDRGDRHARQFWAAGGIGVTPFLAGLDELRADPVAAPQVELHYSTRTAAADPFVTRLQSLCAELPSVTLRIHDSAAGASLTPKTLAAQRGTWRRAEVRFCRPRRFGDQLRAGLRRAWGWRMRFRRERFELR